METYSHILPHTATESTGDIRVSPHSHLRGHVYYQGCSTIYELFQRSCRLYKDNSCLGERAIDSVGNAGHYVFKSYKDIHEHISSFASGLTAYSLVQKKTGSLGIYMKNSSSWIIAEQACFTLSAVTVPLYDTLGVEAVEYIINHVGLETVVCTNTELESLLQVKNKCPTLRHIILTSVQTREQEALAEQVHVRLYSFHNVLAAGRQIPSDPCPPSNSDICTICYTSGTTGPPKGAIITHGNLVSAVASGLKSFIPVTNTDYYLSFLPLAHIFERLSVTAILSCGGAVGFSQGNPLLIVDDLKALQPTIFCAVPRLLNRIFDKIMQKSEEDNMSSKLLRQAITVKLYNYSTQNGVSHWFYDRLIFNKIKASLGLNRVKFLLSGGAPCAAPVMAFFRILLGSNCSCHEGYGQTETSGATTMTEQRDSQGGDSHVGTPFPSLDIRLADIPEMSYLHTDTDHHGRACYGRGEIEVRGPHIFKGYYKNSEETQTALSEDGWLKTGDVGLWTAFGQLAIIDRRKNIFKLSQGEYIAVEKLENIYTGAKSVAQLFIHGDSTEDSIVAVVVPDIETIPATLQAAGITDIQASSLKEICRKHGSTLKSIIMEEFRILGDKYSLSGFERIKNIHLESELWTNMGSNSILTPTMKLKRPQAKVKYAQEIHDMYAQLKQGHQSALTLRSKL